MIAPLLLGSFIIIVNMGIQIVAVVLMVRYVMSRTGKDAPEAGFATDTRMISVVLLVLFAGHLIQFAVWAGLFVSLGEFESFNTAFYHSTVNFSSLGYGDIVMGEEWRLLGALEACNGVLMFGLSGGTILAVMVHLFSRNESIVGPK
jgi:Ion channel